MSRQKVSEDISSQWSKHMQAHAIWYMCGLSFLIAIVTALFYFPSLHYPFQFDDIANIYKVFYIRHLTFKEAFFSSTRWVPFWINAVNYRLGKFDPYYYRLVNISFHIIGGLLFGWLAYLCLSCKKPRSFIYRFRVLIASLCTLLFLLHPVQTQTVSYVIQGRMEGLVSIWLALACLCYIGLVKTDRRWVKVFYCISMLAAAFLSCGTKEIAIVLPGLIALIDWFFLAQADYKKMMQRWWVYALLSLCMLGIFLYFLKPHFFLNILGLKMEARNNIGNVLTENPEQKILPLHFLISQFKVILHYICMFIWPFGISVEYDWKLVDHFFALDCFFPFLALCSLFAYLAMRWLRNTSDVIVFCWAWFFLCLAPRSSIIPSSELMADYKTYLASFGIFLLFSYGICYTIVWLTQYVQQHYSTLQKHAKLVPYACMGLLMMSLGYSTVKRNEVWRSGEEFWTNIIQNAPGKARAYNNLGVALSERGALREAIPYFKRAINMDRRYPDPWNNLAVAYSSEGKVDLAINTLKQAIKIHKYYPEAYNNLASFYIQKKEYEQAEQLLQVALQLRPHYGKAFYNLGKIKFDQGSMEQALDCFKAACLEGDMDNFSGYTIYANAALSCKKYDQALMPLQKLLEINPHHVETFAKLGQAYLGMGKFGQATSYFKKYVAQAPQDGRGWFNLGECYNQQKDMQNALQAFKKAHRLKFNSPFLPLRMAACIEQLGDQQSAYTILKSYVDDETMPGHLKLVAQRGLDQLDEQRKKVMTS